MLSKLIGSRNARELKRMGRIVERVNAHAEKTSALSNAEMRQKTDEFRKRVGSGESLDDILPEAFALVREAAHRTNATRHFDVQLVGGIALHEGRIAEMRTGEGKTLVATLPAYLNALTGQGVHIVTVNDYLARRDANWMGPIYRAVGMDVGVVQSQQDSEPKRSAYAADVTYGTNNEFGFDYLRDNMAFRQEDRHQRGLSYAIVDEVDSILIDEARTPLIISGPTEESTSLYQKINKLAPILDRQEQKEETIPKVLGGEQEEDTGDFFIDEKNRTVELTERGHQRVEEQLIKMGLLEAGDSLYSPTNLVLLHHVNAALRAHFLYKRDVQYMVQDGEIVIIDEHTGRAMPGRRWSEGNHQAVEAKEGVQIRQESQTLASTTFQNYFRIYSKLAGMTGTADTEAFEFRQIYKLDVVVIPTHMPMIRDDRNDLIYMSLDEKYEAIVADVNECINTNRPVLVGTTSIESSERLSRELANRKIHHNVLNAKQHEREADIIAEAGRPGKVTIATNMAGRGTDIVLGGNYQVELAKLGEKVTEHKTHDVEKDWQKRHDHVVASGGLHIIGTERHESRRIDNQLRGRSGRQGDPGSSRFYLSMEDDLMRLFTTGRWSSMIQSMGLERGEAIEAKMVNNAIEKAQRRVEGRNFDIRKNLLEFDDVANDQRQVIYQQRNDLMELSSIHDMLAEMRADVVNETLGMYIPAATPPEHWSIDELQLVLEQGFGTQVPIQDWIDSGRVETEQDIRDQVLEQIEERYRSKRDAWRQQGIDADAVEKQIMLTLLDRRWKEHLLAMDHLRQGIHLRAFAQKQPKQEYKRESFLLFQELLKNIQHDVIRMLSRMEIDQRRDPREAELRRRQEAMQKLQYQHASDNGAPSQEANKPTKAKTFVRSERKVGRNEPCPCGSGKKYKLCHGRAG